MSQSLMIRHVRALIKEEYRLQLLTPLHLTGLSLLMNIHNNDIIVETHPLNECDHAHLEGSTSW